MDFQSHRAAAIEQLHRGRGVNPLFRAIPTGTYAYRYRDAGTDTRDFVDGNANMTIESERAMERGNEKGESVAGNLKREVGAGRQKGDAFLPLTEKRRVEEDNNATSQDSSDAVLYRETAAVASGAMTLLSKQVLLESPLTGAKGRAREREIKRPGVSRIMPSQALIDAAKSISYPSLIADGYLATRAEAQRREKVILVGCGPESEKSRSRERDEQHLSGQESDPRIMPNQALVDAAADVSQPPISHPHLDDSGFVLDGKWAQGPEGVRLLAYAPGSSTMEKSGERGREGERLRSENVRLKSEIARLRDANHNRVEGGGAAARLTPSPETADAATSSSQDVWGESGMGGQPRRTAIRGGRVGASLMSQEVLVEGYAGGKGRAREREEKQRFEYLARELDDENDVKDLSSGEEEWRGRMKMRDAAAAALANLPEEVIAKYAADRPSRIWRDHSHEILVEGAAGGSKGRRREVNMKAAGRPRFMPSQEMRNAAAGVAARADDAV